MYKLILFYKTKLVIIFLNHKMSNMYYYHYIFYFLPSSLLSMMSLLSLPVEGPDPGLLSPSADI